MLAEMDWNRLLKIEYVSVIMGCMVAIVWAIGHFWVSYEKHRSEMSLKRNLVNRGMSAEEIERIITARGSTASDDDEA